VQVGTGANVLVAVLEEPRVRVQKHGTSNFGAKWYGHVCKCLKMGKINVREEGLKNKGKAASTTL
jgi:hypothetical protein